MRATVGESGELAGERRGNGRRLIQVSRGVVWVVAMNACVVHQAEQAGRQSVSATRTKRRNMRLLNGEEGWK